MISERISRHYGSKLNEGERLWVLVMNSGGDDMMNRLVRWLFEVYNPGDGEITIPEHAALPLYRRAAGSVASWLDPLRNAWHYRQAARAARHA